MNTYLQVEPVFMHLGDIDLAHNILMVIVEGGKKIPI